MFWGILFHIKNEKNLFGDLGVKPIYRYHYACVQYLPNPHSSLFQICCCFRAGTTKKDDDSMLPTGVHSPSFEHVAVLNIPTRP